MLRHRHARTLPALAALALLSLFAAGSTARRSVGDTVTLLAADDLAAQARFELIASAQHEIDVAYFAIRDDSFSRTFLQALQAASERGVRVRVVVDGMNNHIPVAMQVTMLHSGIELREYNRPRILRAQALTRRLHDKLLCGDRAELILGSRNVGAAHFGLAACPGENYLDLDIRVRGTIAAEASCYFDELWNNPALTPVDCRNLARKTDGQMLKQVRRRLTARRHGNAARACRTGAAMLEFETLEVAPERMRFLCDPGGRKCKSCGVHVVLYELLDSAQCSIVIESPYLVPDAEFGRVLQAALERNVRVRILTNSYMSTNHLIVYPAYRDMIRRFHKLGAEIWESAGPRIFHAKTVVVDARVACVTSFNFDPRSAHLDTQSGVVIDSPEVAAQLLLAVDTHFQNATAVRFPRGPIADHLSWLSSPWQAGDTSMVGPVRMQLLRLFSHVLVRQL
jgi:putative cardiolipin synthase